MVDNLTMEMEMIP